MAIDENLTGDADGYTASHRPPGGAKRLINTFMRKRKTIEPSGYVTLLWGFFLCGDGGLHSVTDVSSLTHSASGETLL